MELPEIFTQFVWKTILEHFRESAKHAYDKDDEEDNAINQTALAVALIGLAQFETDPELKRLMLQDAHTDFCYHPDACFYTGIVNMAEAFVTLGSIDGTILCFSLTMYFLLQAIYMEPTNELYTKCIFSIVEMHKKYMEFFRPSTSEHTSSDSHSHSHSDSEDPTIELFASRKEIHGILEMHKYYIERYKAATIERTSSNSEDHPTYPPFLDTMLEIQKSYIEFVNKLETSEQTLSDSELDESFEKISVQYKDFIHQLIFEDARLKSEEADNLTELAGAEEQKKLINCAITRLEEAAGLETNRDKAEETLCYLSIAYTALACLTSDIAESKLYFRLAEDHIKEAITQFSPGDFYFDLYSNSSAATKRTKQMYDRQGTTGGVSCTFSDEHVIVLSKNAFPNIYALQGYKRMEKTKISAMS